MTSLAAAILYLSAAQIQWANTAYQIGEPYGLGYTASAISGQESSWCKFKGASWSRGCMGLKRSTARIFDPQVTRKILTEDNQRNIADGILFLRYCQANTKSWKRMVACFHWGLPVAEKFTQADLDSDKYVNAVIIRVRQLQAIPVSND